MSLPALPQELPNFLEQYLPKPVDDASRPFVTLTYAQSMDSRIAAQKGIQTKLSHMETKTMTHYLRSRHDSILVGIGTVLADDPKLNCRFRTGVKKRNIRPVVLDPHAKWNYTESQLHGICQAGEGLAPYIIVDSEAVIKDEDKLTVEADGGEYIRLGLASHSPKNWDTILSELKRKKINSVMIEGGAMIISDLLCSPNLVDSVIITLAPVFLGSKGVEVSPMRVVNLIEPSWWHGVQDSVLCARLR